MKGAKKAKLLVFLIIVTVAFICSLSIAKLTIHEDNNSYKLISINNDSFEPTYINKVPTITPKNTTNTTNKTNQNITKITNKTIEKTNTTKINNTTNKEK